MSFKGLYIVVAKVAITHAIREASRWVPLSRLQMAVLVQIKLQSLGGRGWGGVYIWKEPVRPDFGRTHPIAKLETFSQISYKCSGRAVRGWWWCWWCSSRAGSLPLPVPPGGEEMSAATYRGLNCPSQRRMFRNSGAGPPRQAISGVLPTSGARTAIDGGKGGGAVVDMELCHVVYTRSTFPSALGRGGGVVGEKEAEPPGDEREHL